MRIVNDKSTVNINYDDAILTIEQIGNDEFALRAFIQSTAFFLTQGTARHVKYEFDQIIYNARTDTGMVPMGVYKCKEESTGGAR
jgi:hypothetical protein